MAVGLADEDSGKAVALDAPPGMLDEARGLEQRRQREPEGFAHLVVRHQRLLVLRAVDEGGNHERGDARGVLPMHVVEPSEPLGAREIEPYLLERLALGGGARVGIPGIDATARERHVPRPRIAGVARALDEEHLRQRTGVAQDHRYGGLAHAAERLCDGAVRGQAAADFGDRRHAHRIASVPPMLERPAPHAARRILDLARTDRDAAQRALAEQPLDVQLELVCEAPVARRAALLDLLPEPERVIPLLPEAELCFTVKAVGLESASWLLSHATPEQLVACLDLDAWQGTLPDYRSLDTWIAALVEAGEEPLLRGLQAIDPELMTLFLKARVEVLLRTNDDDWQDPIGAETLDGQFFFRTLSEGDDAAAIIALLRTLFEHDYWMYFRLLQSVIWELASETEEWALRWRAGRLEDLGFPPWEEAMNIYRYLPPEQRGELPQDVAPLATASRWQLPVAIPRMPARLDEGALLFRTIAALENEERRTAFHALVALANKIAVADRLALSDAESTPRAIEKAARFASAGLELLAREHGLDPIEVLRRAPLDRLFRIGANLDPTAAKP